MKALKLNINQQDQQFLMIEHIHLDMNSEVFRNLKLRGQNGYLCGNYIGSYPMYENVYDISSGSLNVIRTVYRYFDLDFDFSKVYDRTIKTTINGLITEYNKKSGLTKLPKLMYEHSNPNKVIENIFNDEYNNKGMVSNEYIKHILDTYTGICLITKDENKRLSDAGLNESSSNPFDTYSRYKETGIEVLDDVKLFLKDNITLTK